MSGLKPNKKTKFYKNAAVYVYADGYGIELDGKPIRTPAGAVLMTPSQALAQAVADEWNAQGENLDFHTLVLTQLLNTAHDRTAVQHASICAELCGYLQTDLVCYRVTDPQDLVCRQQAEWDPLLEWFQQQYGIALGTTTTLTPPVVPKQADTLLATALQALDIPALTAVHALSGLSHSLVLSLACVAEHITAAQLCHMSWLEESWQNERWGEDEEAIQRRTAMQTEATAIERYLQLARES